MQPHMEARGMFKSLSPDLSYVPDPAIQKKDNTTSTTSKPT